jgi:hypothetical protein
VSGHQQTFYPGQDDVLPDQRKARHDEPVAAGAHAAPAAPRRPLVASWAVVPVAVVCAVVSLVGGSKPVSLVLLLVTVALSVPAVRSVVRGVAQRQPSRPVPETVPPVVIGPPPAARVPALANSCHWCNRPLTDFESRQLGADPNCRTRRGPHQAYTVNPHYVAWGNALHALRVQQESERPAIAARNATAAAAYAEAIATGAAISGTPGATAAQASPRRAMAVAVITVACTLIAVGGVI